jgi:hypothetical protein
MEGQVPQSVTLCIGDIWFDVSVGPSMTLMNQHLGTMTASPTEHDQGVEVGKWKPMDKLHYEQPMNEGSAMIILPSSSFLHGRT